MARFTGDALNLLKRYGPSTQQTYAYSLLDHLHRLDVHGKEPRDVTFDDLRRYLNEITAAAGYTGPRIGDMNESRSGLPRRGTSRRWSGPTTRRFRSRLGVSDELIQALTTLDKAGYEAGGIRRPRWSNPLAPRKTGRRPRFLPDEVVAGLFEPGVPGGLRATS